MDWRGPPLCACPQHSFEGRPHLIHIRARFGACLEKPDSVLSSQLWGQQKQELEKANTRTHIV